MNPQPAPVDWARLLAPVARVLLDPVRGEPVVSGEQWRYGRRGSLSVDCARGAWFDHEAGAGGGVIDLVEHVCAVDRAGAVRWLREQGFLDADVGGALRAGGFPPPACSAFPARLVADADLERRRAALVAALWAAAVSVEGSPAERYLAHRGVWRAAAPVTPGALRWLAAGAGVPAPVPALRWYGLPRAAGGAVVFAWERAGALRAVSLEALGRDAAVLPRRWRRTVGSRSGALFHARGAGAGAAVDVAEGEIDALAVALRRSGAVVGAGGTSGMVGIAAALAAPVSVVLHADRGRGGERAVVRALASLRRAGVASRVCWYATDPADALAEVCP